MIGVEVDGAGTPLVCVHGSTADRSRWAPIRASLAETFELHLMDRRGRGASTQESSAPYALEREADDVIAVAEAAGGAVRLLGHSYGALISLEVLRLRADLVEVAVLYEPPFDTPGHRIAPPEAFGVVTERLDAGDREGALIAFYELIIGVDPTPLRRLPIWQARLAAVHTLVREGEIGLSYVPDARAFRGVDVPVHVLAGTTSPPAFGAAARTATGALPRAELHWLEGYGHTMIDADPIGFTALVKDLPRR